MSRRGRRVVAGMLALVTAAVAVSACSPRSEDWTETAAVLAAGSPTGVYHDYGSHLATELSRGLDVDLTAEVTAGSVDNLLRVSAGEALLGFAQGDAAADAVAGTGAFTEPLDVQAVARLYDEYLQIVVRDDSAVEDLADLSGRTISLGAENSGVNVIATRVLHAAGVAADVIDDPQLDLGGSIAAMERGEIDGFFWVGGLPTPGIADLAETIDVRLLPVEQDWVNAVNERYSHAYRPADVPAGTYGLDAAVTTLAVPNYLVTVGSTPPGVVHDLVAGLFAARTTLAADVPAAALLDRRSAIFTGPVPLHPGAEQYYRDLRR